MLMNFKFLHHVKAKSLLVFGWINRVILGNRKLTISVVPVFIEGKDPLDERIEFFISKESDDLEEKYYEDDAHSQKGPRQLAEIAKRLTPEEFAELRASPQESSELMKSFQRLAAKRVMERRGLKFKTPED